MTDKYIYVRPDGQLGIDEMAKEPDCMTCDNTGWVCETHNALPSATVSNRYDACGCSPGAPCLVCCWEMYAARTR